MGFAALLISISLLEVSPALAMERTGTEPLRLDPPAQPPPPNDEDLLFIAFFTDDLSLIMDLSGNVIDDEGEHGGEARCNGDNCNKKAQVIISPSDVVTTVYEYKFTTRQALDPDEGTAVVSGIGTISSRGQKERFSFTASFRDNRDGTVAVTYVASRPDASFIIPEAPGTFTIYSRR
jgi:hypothetical protein